MSEKEERNRALAQRTKRFALRIINMYVKLPKSTHAQILAKQVLRSGTSVGAHYREAMRARSPAEFISKIEGGLQELEETAYWLELLVESEIVPVRKVSDLFKELDELTAIFAASARTAKSRK